MRFVNPRLWYLGRIFIPILGLGVLYQLLFWGRIFPGVAIAEIPVGGRTPKQAQVSLSQQVSPPTQIILAVGEKTFPLETSQLELAYNFEMSVQKAQALGRTGDALADLNKKLTALKDGVNLPLVFSLNEAVLDQEIAAVAEQISVAAVEPKISVEKGQVLVLAGQNGQELDKRQAKQQILNLLSQGKLGEIKLPVRQLLPALSPEQAQVLKQTAEKFLGKTLVLKWEYQTFSYPAAELLNFLDPQGGFDQLEISQEVSDLSNQVNREPQNARFAVKDGKVTEFAPAKDGIRVKEEELTQKVTSALDALLATEKKTLEIEIPVIATKPLVSTEQVNNLGIKELVGRGSSRFRGSIQGRIHNIDLASSRISGTLVAPGEVFSFNQVLGDVSAFTGYQQAYIIKEGRTVLGDGGGVCQVSSTLFRALLDAGLPIVERHQHSYRVAYYEQDAKPGFDATVYSPSVDLRFKNDTPAHLLIQAVFDAKSASLVFEVYGTGDGRQVTISSPRLWDARPAPPPLYQDDPTLPAGKTKQVDFAAAGAKVAFDYKVVRGGEVLQDRTFYSNFRPWQAVFLKGTGPTQ